MADPVWQIKMQKKNFIQKNPNRIKSNRNDPNRTKTFIYVNFELLLFLPFDLTTFDF